MRNQSKIGHDKNVLANWGGGDFFPLSDLGFSVPSYNLTLIDGKRQVTINS